MEHHYLVNAHTGDVIRLEQGQYHLVRNDSDALLDALEDVGFNVPKPERLVCHPNSTRVAEFEIVAA